jgi:hypothetical protein
MSNITPIPENETLAERIVRQNREACGECGGNAYRNLHDPSCSQYPEEKLYLVCNGCGEACDDIKAAHEHGASDPQSKVWCGDDGFVIMPESEAL